ncbi:MAG: M1 family metallopeptidase [Flavobacteriales bacterium]|nr:M1 family metallopeptidase [Flavobacteriales bacterium]
MDSSYSDYQGWLLVAGSFILALGQMVAQTSEAAYFQQQVDHVIEVALDDQSHEVRGHIATTYINNSPDTLDALWIHLWPNAYANGKTALAKQEFRNGNMFMFYAMQRQLGGIDSLDFRVDGSPVTWEFHPEHMDIARLVLPEPLPPGAKLTYETPFRVRIPLGRISRLGHIGESYQMTQWYPKPAVYDRDGWHEMPYLTQGEFYSEYGSFDVSITLPKNYVVGATGDMSPEEADNAREMQFLDSLALATSRQMDMAFFESEEAQSDSFPPSSLETKTLRFKQTQVHDFAWFADKRWMVLKGSVALPNSAREVTTWAMFTSDQAKLWRESLEYLADATFWYSKWNGDYPYNHVTAVDGTISAGGGMEYPNITVIGRAGSDLGLEQVIVHEVGHNWFYGILGSNERTNAWMDEGINSFNESRYFVEKYGDELGLAGSNATPLMEKLEVTRFSYQSKDQLAYLMSARMLVDQPMQCHSDSFSQINYGTIVYMKSAAAFEYLRQALGSDVFDVGMHAYFDAWKFKHPSPADLRISLETSTGKDLSWFFDDIVQTTGHTNYALHSLNRQGDDYTLRVQNRGDIAGPFSVSGQTGDSTWVEFGWYNGVAPGDVAVVPLPSKDETGLRFRQFRLDEKEQMLEYDRHNNSMRTRGLLRKIEPLSIRLFTRLDRSDRTQLGYLPVTGWNDRDGWMPGLALHNTVLPARDFEWLLMPMWSTQMSNLGGVARLSLRRNEWRMEAQARRFTSDVQDLNTETANRSSLRLIGQFNRQPAQPLSSELLIEAVDLRLIRNYTDDMIDPGFAPLSSSYKQAFSMNYKVKLKQPLLLQSINIGWRVLGSSQHMANSSWLGLNQGPGLFPSMDRLAKVLHFGYDGRRRINEQGRTLDWRIYGAVVTGDEGVYPLLAAGPTGSVDPMMDYTFFSRSGEGWLGQQVSGYQGGLPLQSIQASQSLLSAGVSWESPLFLHLFAGGIMADTDPHWVAGVSLPLGFLNIQFPLIIDGEFGVDGARLTWRLDLQALSPYQLFRNGMLSIY